MKVAVLWKAFILAVVLLAINGLKPLTLRTYTSVQECNSAFSSAVEWVPGLKKCDAFCSNQTSRLQAQKIIADLNLAIIESNHLNPKSDRIGNYLSDNFKFIFLDTTEFKRDQVISYWKSLSRGERVLISCGKFEQSVIKNGSVAFRGFVLVPPTHKKQEAMIVISPMENKLLEIDQRNITVIPVD